MIPDLTETYDGTWHTDPDECPHSNWDTCPTCDFDGYYAARYIDCPWRDA